MRFCWKERLKNSHPTHGQQRTRTHCAKTEARTKAGYDFALTDPPWFVDLKPAAGHAVPLVCLCCSSKEGQQLSHAYQQLNLTVFLRNSGRCLNELVLEKSLFSFPFCPTSVNVCSFGFVSAGVFGRQA